jgi:hypothetical protein
MAIFISLLKSGRKDEELRQACCEGKAAGVKVYDVDPSAFAELRSAPFAYWLSPEMRDVFARSSEMPISTRIGVGTLGDARFLRAWWEVGGTDDRWVPFAKGGEYSEFYLDLAVVIAWGRDGAELRTYVAQKVGSASRKVQSVDFYFRPGLYWSRRSQKGLTVRCLPAGSIFADTGPGAFAVGDRPHDLLIYLAILNSKVFRYFVHLFVGFGSYEVGVIQSIPIPGASLATQDALSRLGRSGWSLRRAWDSIREISHSFVAPGLLQVDGRSFEDRLTAWAARVADADAEFEGVLSEIDELCFALYGISEEDRRAIVEGFGVTDEGVNDEGDADGEVEEEATEIVELDTSGLAAGLVSWAIGVGVGRFDVRLVTRERSLPEESEPFDPLRKCSPGMLSGDDGLPLTVPPESYPVEVAPVLVDDPGHPLDITARVRSVFDTVFVEDADTWWADVGVALGAKGGEVSAWLNKGFFEHHLKGYSKARRKAPILWPIGTRSGSYLIWLYAHQVSADSLFQVLNDVVVPKALVEERKLTQLRQDAGLNPTASQRKAIDKQERFVGELRELREELDAVAPLWAPYLNDGIVIVLAPLWRLFAHHRAWSNELKKHWNALARGDYDWAQLAMHLWPERVVPKCVEDRSLAIAHGLDDVFWVRNPNSNDKWQPREISATHIELLVAQRHNPATSAALRTANR